MKLKSKMRRGICYSRISTIGQVLNESGTRKDDASPEMHKKRCIEYLKMVSGREGSQYKITDFLIDEGFSGKNTNRPNYQMMMKLIEGGGVDFVICTELSRLSRTVSDFLVFADHCERHNTDLIIVGNQIDTTSHHGKFILTILVALAQFEREMTGQRVSENVRARLIAEGKINGAAEILGLIRDPNRKGHFIADPDALKQVERIFNIYLESSSKAQAFSQIQKENILGKDGEHLTKRALDCILENALWRYRGKWHLNLENKDLDESEVFESERYQEINLDHGPLIDLELLDKVVRKLNESNQKFKKCGKDGRIYLLSNLLHDEFGNPLKGFSAKGGEYRYYESRKSKVRVPADEIEKFILRRLNEYFEDAALFEGLLKESIRKRELNINEIGLRVKELNKEILEVERKEESLKSKLLESALDEYFVTYFREEMESLKAHKNEIKLEREKLEAFAISAKEEAGLHDLKKTVRAYLKVVSTLKGAQLRDHLETLIDRIVIKNDGILELVVRGEKESSKVGMKKAVTEDGLSSYSKVNGGSDGTRTRGLLRDRQTL
jgi:site-specific DNA recombinase